MADTNTVAGSQYLQRSTERALLQPYAQKLQEIDSALLQEAARLRRLAESDEAQDANLTDTLRNAAIHLDALAWSVRNSDLDDPEAGKIEMPARAGAPSTSAPALKDTGDSGEGTRTDLGEGAGGTDVGRDTDTPAGTER